MGGKIKKQGYSKPRRSADGTQRWTALYLITSTGQYLSAGTWDTFEEAEAAWQDTLSLMRRGLMTDPRKGRMSFRDYAEVFMSLQPHLKVNSRKNYRGYITREFNPFFGSIALYEITPEHIATWIMSLTERGLAPATIRTYKASLSGMLTFAVHLGYISFNPALAARIQKEKRRRIKAASVADISALIAGLPGPAAKMLVHLEMHTGLRWGELTELRGSDVVENPDIDGAYYLEVQRQVTDAGPDHPEFGTREVNPRYWVEDSPKNGRDRIVSLSVSISANLEAFMEEYGIGPDDLLFSHSMIMNEWRLANPEPEPTIVTVPDDLGRTEPNEAGRTYRHGTMTAYTAGRCKCEWCRRAFAIYRAERRAAGKADRPTPKPGVIRSVNTSDHLDDSRFRELIFYPALQIANISRRVTFHDLRHTHATWLARKGLDIMELRDRLGHSSLETTKRYLDEAEIIETTASDMIDDLFAEADKPKRGRSGRPLRVVN